MKAEAGPPECQLNYADNVKMNTPSTFSVEPWEQSGKTGQFARIGGNVWHFLLDIRLGAA